MTEFSQQRKGECNNQQRHHVRPWFAGHHIADHLKATVEPAACGSCDAAQGPKPTGFLHLGFIKQAWKFSSKCRGDREAGEAHESYTDHALKVQLKDAKGS